jgi:hypothetical protein
MDKNLNRRPDRSHDMTIVYLSILVSQNRRGPAILKLWAVVCPHAV